MTVYVTHGRKYHIDAKCPLMNSGEALHDWDGDDYGGSFSMGAYRREESSPQRAAMRGKLPCLHCVPVEARVFPPLYGQDFGHEPVLIDVGYCGGCERCGDAEEREVCVRCLRVDRNPGEQSTIDAVDWPCTSAIVLGLVDREERAA